ncbi:MAG: ABC transporter permease [Cyclobacteriaceae bacterium]|nr:ABC transporter permease [Cyclobacteriaceae bacterium HetDA_MAG_MS6]
MFRNYLHTVLRQIRKNKTFSVINVTGLAIGMAACLIIAQYVSFHLSFDDYHQKSDRLFQLYTEITKSGDYQGKSMYSRPLVGPTLEESQPEVARQARIKSVSYLNFTLISKNKQQVLSFDEPSVYLVDLGLFEMFDLPLVAGSFRSFGAPEKMILTGSTARKYFKTPDEAIGKSVVLDGNQGAVTYEIVGVMADVPENSHFEFSVLISMPSHLNYDGQSEWSWTTSTSVMTYLEITDPSIIPNIISRVNELYQENLGDRLDSYGYEVQFGLQNIKDIHLHSEVPQNFKPGVNPSTIFAMGGVALIILIIAWINYLNLSLVKTLERSKEVGIRKVLGSSGRQLSSLFVMESMVLNLISFVLALTFTQISASWISEMAGFQFRLHQETVLILVLLVFMGSAVSGLYPTIMVRALTVTNLLIGKRIKRNGFNIRPVLVSFQFVITFILVAGTITVYQQITYMKNADLGINIDDTLAILAPPGNIHSDDRTDVTSYNMFRTELKKLSGIKDVVSAGEIPGQPVGWSNDRIRLKNAPEDQSISVGLVPMDIGFFNFFELEILAGRYYRRGDDPWTEGEVVINEKAAKMLGFENAEQALGQRLDGFWNENGLRVIGVVEDHHQVSLHSDFEPILYILSTWSEFYFVRLDIDNDLRYDERIANIQRIVQEVHETWSSVFEPYHMDYFFLDQSFDIQYQSDERFGNTFGTFSILAILIACLGLFGLSAFTIQRRTKEIGVRKVLGAGAIDLIYLLSSRYILLISMSYLIAMPLAWYAFQTWLEGFAFRITLGWMVFAIPFFVVIAIAFSTILIRILQSIKTNPVESLRYE